MIWLGRLVFLLGGAGMLALAVAHTASRSIVARRSPPRSETLELSPPDAEELRLTTTDGVELGATFWPKLPPHASARRRAPQSQPAVLLTHGRGASRSARQAQAQVFRDLGCPILLLTLRAHGDSGGDRCTFGWDERHDIRAGLRALHRREPKRKILAVGSSMGAAAIAFALSDVAEPPPSDQPEVAACILECPYGSLDEAMRQRFALRLPPTLAAAASGLLRFVAPTVLPTYDRIKPVEALDRVQGPFLRYVLMGENDDRVSPADHAAFRRKHDNTLRCIEIPNARHDRLLNDNPERYCTSIGAVVFALTED